jgi:hypothetical protein
MAATACTRANPETFPSPEAAVHALSDAAARDNPDALRVIFGRGADDVIDSSDPATARQNREVFTVAMAEGWKLRDNGSGGKTLVAGNEEWPFPVPIVKTGSGWSFDTAAGKEEIIARRIGRNELAAVRLCRTYAAAQRRYAQDAHDGRPAGRFARVFRSDPNKHNGLYWLATAGEKRSPLDDLLADAPIDRREAGPGTPPAPLYGYYFKILTAQGPAAPGGTMDYLADGEMTRGFALVAWPARYDLTGVMTFVINQDGVVYQRDLGPATDTTARNVTLYDPDAKWWEPVTESGG